MSAHVTDIFALAVTPSQIISASGSSSLYIHSTTQIDFPLVQTLGKVHRLGIHHLTTSGDGQYAASAGFSGEVIIWQAHGDTWAEENKIVGAVFSLSILSNMI